MKKHKALIISIPAAAVSLPVFFIPWGKFWGTEFEYSEDGSQICETPYRFFQEAWHDDWVLPRRIEAVRNPLGERAKSMAR